MAREVFVGSKILVLVAQHASESRDVSFLRPLNRHSTVIGLSHKFSVSISAPVLLITFQALPFI